MGSVRIDRAVLLLACALIPSCEQFRPEAGSDVSDGSVRSGAEHQSNSGYNNESGEGHVSYVSATKSEAKDALEGGDSTIGMVFHVNGDGDYISRSDYLRPTLSMNVAAISGGESFDAVSEKVDEQTSEQSFELVPEVDGQESFVPDVEPAAGVDAAEESAGESAEEAVEETVEEASVVSDVKPAGGVVENSIVENSMVENSVEDGSVVSDVEPAAGVGVVEKSIKETAVVQDVVQVAGRAPAPPLSSLMPEAPVVPVSEVVTDEVIVPAASVATDIPAVSKPAVKDAADASWAYDYLKRALGGKTEIALQVKGRSGDENIYDLIGITDAVSIALENNYEIKAAIEEGKSRYWDKMGSYGQYLPSVNLDVSVGRERSRPAAFNDSNGDREADDSHVRRDRSLIVKQPIFDLQILSDIISSSSKEDLSRLELLNTQNTIATDTIKSYLKLLQSKITTQLADDYLAELAKLSKIMSSRVEAGGAVSADLDRILSKTSEVESAKVEAGAEYEIALSEFRRLTGIVPERLVLPPVLVPDFPKEIELAQQRAYTNNPNYLVSLMKIDLAKEDRNKAASGLVPKVYAQYMSDYNYNAGGAAQGNPVDGVYPTQRTDRATVVAQWSLYGGTQMASALSGAAKQKEMYLASMDVQERMDQALEINYTAIRSANDRVSVLKTSVEANERMVSGFEEQFKFGTRSLFELLDAHEQLYSSRVNLTRAIFSNSQAAFQILQQTGDVVSAAGKENQGL